MYGIYTSFLWRSYDLSWELYQQYHPAAALDVVTRQGWLPDNREEIVGNRSTERSSTVGLIKYPRLFFREDLLSKRFSFEKIFFQEDFLSRRFSFQKNLFRADFLSSRFSIDNSFCWRFFLSGIFSFEKVKNSPTLVYRLLTSTNKHWHLCILFLVRLFLCVTYDQAWSDCTFSNSRL